jgi:hypothetical protein
LPARFKVNTDHAVVLCYRAWAQLERRAQWRPFEYEGMKLAVLAARIDAIRHIGDELSIVDFPGPFARHTLRVDARNPRA